MNSSEPKQDYLAKAEAAEKSAAQTSDVVTRNSLLRQAKNYRSLAVFIHGKTSQRDG